MTRDKTENLKMELALGIEWLCVHFSMDICTFEKYLQGNTREGQIWGRKRHWIRIRIMNR